MRVAVVGAGPKGLHAVAALLRAWPAGRDLRVDCLDARPPGTGAAYAVEQPDFLRLNVHPRVLHLPPIPPLPDWLRAHGVDPSGDVPRSRVGEYLDEAVSRLAASAPDVTVRFASARVTGIDRAEVGWHLDTTAGALVADEVLLATGHAPDHDAALVHLWEAGQPTPLVPAVYPVDENLSRDRVPSGSVVAVRGAALTFIDCVLALTEGREVADRPSRILPVAPSGALLLAKPGVPVPDDLQRVLDGHAARLPLRLLAEEQPFDAALAAVRAAAVAVLVAQGVAEPDATGQVDTALRTGFDPDLTGPGRARRALLRSIQLAQSGAGSSPSWALGRAWSGLYAPMVAALAHRRPDPDQWRRFSRAAATLEKFTFGPPLPNAKRLAALLCDVDGEHDHCTGLVCLEWLERDVAIAGTVTGLRPGERLPDVVVDAVLSPPGASSARTPLVDALVAAGLARVALPQRGLEVTVEAQCVGRDGRPTPGLSAVGRLTEDVVIGHDTLSVAMHDEIDRWAHRLARPQER